MPHSQHSILITPTDQSKETPLNCQRKFLLERVFEHRPKLLLGIYAHTPTAAGRYHKRNSTSDGCCGLLSPPGAKLLHLQQENMSDPMLPPPTCEKAKKPVPWLLLVRPPSLPFSKAMLVSINKLWCLLRPPDEPVKAIEAMPPERALPRLSPPELVTVLAVPWELPPRLQPLLMRFISPP